MKILVTGGLGYIGSHTVVELLNNNYDVVVVDNLYNASLDVKDSIKKITGKDFKYYNVDCTNYNDMEEIFKKEDINAVIHFAGYKAVGESVEKPIMYYRNNLDSTLTLLELMKKYNVKKFIFSSSATVYGTPEKLPLTEDCKTGDATNPYGETKIMIERILTDVYKSDNSMSIILLRYFNPIGSHKSYLLGENPNGIPNNLMPYIVRVADGELDHLNIFGDDYDTPDGTGVRDYIHVVDLAKGHIKALEKASKGPGLNIYNLGTGHGYSVLDIVKTFEKVNNVKVPYVITQRRAGDIAACYADPSKAEKELGWKAEYTLDDMCLDSYQYILHKNGKK